MLISLGGKAITLCPVNIDKQLKKTDLKMKFDFAMSPIVQTTEYDVDCAVSIIM